VASDFSGLSFPVRIDSFVERSEQQQHVNIDETDYDDDQRQQQQQQQPSPINNERNNLL
jgi:hypothetical protein